MERLRVRGGTLLGAACLGFLGSVACSETSTSPGASGGSKDASASGGASSGGGGVGSGGVNGSAGTAAGGAANGGAPGASGGKASSLPEAGAGGALPVDAATSPLPPKPSAGCGQASPPSGTLSIQVSGNAAEYVLSIPAAYDPAHAYPLGFAFHGRGRTGPNCHDGDCAGFQSVMKDDAVLVYMTSQGGDGWEGATERELNVQFFQTLLAHVKASYCVDESRVFVAGTSSGAHFVNILGCRFGDQLLATAPVAGYLPEKTGCVGEVAALVIHGVDDSHVAFTSGEEARDFYIARNGCGTSSVPPLGLVHDGVVQNRESHGCVEYPGCDPRKNVMWCEHSEGGYDGSTHGWPSFGGQQIWDFVRALK